MDAETRAALIDEIEEQGTPEDIRRLGRLVRATDTEADRAHLRLLIVRVEEQLCPGPPEELERAGREVIATLRGKALRCGCETRRTRAQ